MKTFISKTLIGVAALSMVLAAGQPARATSIHFVNTSAAVDASGNLVASFKEAGLGAGQAITYNLTADATAVWGCINGGGKHPKAANKTSVNGPVSGTATFFAARNGNITGSLTASPPGPGAAISCGTGQTEALVSVSYTNVSLSDTTTPLDAAISGTFSRTFFN